MKARHDIPMYMRKKAHIPLFLGIITTIGLMIMCLFSNINFGLSFLPFIFGIIISFLIDYSAYKMLGYGKYFVHRKEYGEDIYEIGYTRN